MMEGSSSASDDSCHSLCDSDGAKPPFKRQKAQMGKANGVPKMQKKKKTRPFVHQSEAVKELLAIDNCEIDATSAMDIGPENLSPDCGTYLLKENVNLEDEFSVDFENSTRKSQLYPNCEIDEKNCLKPSEAMKLFQEMDAALNKSRAVKRKWLGRRKEFRMRSFGGHTKSKSTEELCSQTNSLSLPKDLVQKKCDCFEYCECFGHRRSLLRSKSLSSLKLSDNSRKSVKLEQSVSMRKCLISSKVAEEEIVDNKLKVQNHCKAMTGQSRCGFQRDCLHLGYGDGLLQASPSSAYHICTCDSDTVYRTDLRKSVFEGVPPDTFRERKQNMKEWFNEFNHEQKNLILKEILELCNMPQIHLLSIKMEPRLHHDCPGNCEDMLTWLPNHLSLYILSYLDPVSLCHCLSVCRAWRQLACEPCLWRRFCCQTTWQLSGTLQQKQLLNNMLPGGKIHWKQVFSERFKLRNNWLKGRCNVRTFEGHTQGISCVQFDDTRIVSGSSDKTVKVWNIRTNTPLSVQTLVGHSGTVRCLHLDGNRLVSGSSDRTIKVWDLSTQQSWSSIACKVTMVGHLHTVRCLQVDDDKVISGSYDKTLKIWNVRTGECKKTLRGHEGEVLCVQYDDTKIMSGSVDKTIKIWNFEGECVKTLEGHHDAVTCLQFNATRIVSGSLDCSLKFWNVNTCKCFKTIDWKAAEGHTRVVRCLQADTWRVVSASDDRTLKIWSLDTGKRLVTLRNHTDGVTCLQFNDSIIVSGSYDKTVKLWDFSCC